MAAPPSPTDCFSGLPFARGRSRKAHAARAVLIEDGEEWYAPRKAVAYVEQTQTTLKKWGDRRRGGCPWLGGEALQTRPLPTAYNRVITYYRKADLDRVRAAQATRPK